MKSATTSITSEVAQIADEYLGELARGEAPDIADYVKRYPQVASVLPEVLPALRMMHELAPALKFADARPVGLDVLDDYRIIGEIGRGGMGVVYEAEQLSLSRRVALKVLSGAAALDPRQRQRFMHEAQSAARLHHQNIVPVYGVGCERGVHYYAMQFIDGQTLGALIA